MKKRDGSWIDVLPTITEPYKNRIHSSTKLTPIQASLEKNEGFVYKILLNKRKKTKPKFQINDLVRLADSLEQQRELFQNLIRLIGLINCIK